MLRPWRIYFYLNIWGEWIEQGFRRMAAQHNPAGIRLLVYGMGKAKGVIEGCERVWDCHLGPNCAHIPTIEQRLDLQAR